MLRHSMPGMPVSLAGHSKCLSRCLPRVARLAFSISDVVLVASTPSRSSTPHRFGQAMTTVWPRRAYTSSSSTTSYNPPRTLDGRVFTVIGAGTLGRRIALMW